MRNEETRTTNPASGLDDDSPILDYERPEGARPLPVWARVVLACVAAPLMLSGLCCFVGGFGVMMDGWHDVPGGVAMSVLGAGFLLGSYFLWRLIEW
jgi:hypothetical protein